jgi:hypothetical protein
VLLEFSSGSWLSLSFLIPDSKVGSVVPKVCVVFLVWFSLDSDGSESGWWTISIWQLVSRVHCPNPVFFFFFLGVFAPQKLDRP